MSAWIASFTKWFLAASTGMKITVISAVAVASAGVVAIPVTIANNSQVLTVEAKQNGNKANAAGTGQKSSTSTPSSTPTTLSTPGNSSSPSPSGSKSSTKSTARVPGAPTNARFNQGGCGPGYCGAAITVNAPSDSGSSAITGYEVGYSTDGGANFTWVSFGNTPNYMMVDPMPASATYDVVVRALNAAGPSATSAMFRLPLSVQMTPSAPTGVSLGGRGCGSGDNGITLSCGGDIVYTPPQNTGVGSFTYMTGYSWDGGNTWTFSPAGISQQDPANLSFETSTFPIGQVGNLFVGVKIVNSYGESPLVSLHFQ